MYKVDGDFVDTFRIFVQEIPIFGKVRFQMQSNYVKQMYFIYLTFRKLTVIVKYTIAC